MRAFRKSYNKAGFCNSPGCSKSPRWKKQSVCHYPGLKRCWQIRASTYSESCGQTLGVSGRLYGEKSGGRKEGGAEAPGHPVEKRAQPFSGSHCLELLRSPSSSCSAQTLPSFLPSFLFSTPSRRNTLVAPSSLSQMVQSSIREAGRMQIWRRRCTPARGCIQRKHEQDPGPHARALTSTGWGAHPAVLGEVRKEDADASEQSLQVRPLVFSFSFPEGRI